MDVEKFRRFTFFLDSDGEEVKKMLVNARETADIKAYQKEENYFLIADVSINISTQKLPEPLKNQQPLERIYELEQKVVYAPEEGQLKEDIGRHKRFVWTLLLEPNLIDEYKHVHAMGMAWPEVTQNMKSIGVLDMEIYLHQARAILIMDTVPDFDLGIVGPKWQQLPRENEWQEYVAKFQRTDPESSIQEKWQDMQRT
ncbi:MAG: L-rhamnose mutarotase [Bacteroidota bacterium]